MATPYLTAGAINVGIGAGDVLLVALTTPNCANGSVDPGEVERLIKRGVKAYLVPNLHAKVYLLGRVAIVGSANLTSNSTTLDEAAMVTRDSGDLATIRAWFDERRGEPVTPEMLRICKKAYKPPKGSRGKKASSLGRASRLWLVGTTEYDPDADEEREITRSVAAAKRWLKRRGGYEIESVCWRGTDAFTEGVRAGDLVILVHEAEVLPHARVGHVARHGGKKRTMIVSLESLKDAETKPWSWLRARLEAMRFPRLGKSILAREVLNEEMRRKLIAITSPEAWGE